MKGVRVDFCQYRLETERTTSFLYLTCTAGARRPPEEATISPSGKPDGIEPSGLWDFVLALVAVDVACYVLHTRKVSKGLGLSIERENTNSYSVVQLSWGIGVRNDVK